MLDLRKSFGDLRSFHNSGLSHPQSGISGNGLFFPLSGSSLSIILHIFR